MNVLGAPFYNFCQVFSVITALLLVSCEKNESPAASLCSGPSALAGCGKPCGSLDPQDPYCSTGLYCDTKTNRCLADCVVGDENSCKGGATCNPNGRCVLPSTDGGNVACEPQSLQLSKQTPYVALLIDRSASMCFQLEAGPCTETNDSACATKNPDRTYTCKPLPNGAKNRWDTLRDFLVGVNNNEGLIHTWQNRVAFSFANYSGTGTGGACISLNRETNGAQTTPALGSYDAIRSAYKAISALYGGTPTGAALSRVYTHLKSVDSQGNPKFVVLATDGVPKSDCENGSLSLVEHVRQTIENAFNDRQNSIRTFVVGISKGFADSTLNAWAQAGAGNPNARFWSTESAAEIENAFNEIRGKAFTCELALPANVSLKVENACLAGNYIKVNGVEATCRPDVNETHPDGWAPVDAKNIRLLGTTCETFKASANPSITTRFNCDAVITSTR